MLKVLAWLAATCERPRENSPDEVFLRFVGKQEPRLLLPLDESVPEAEREYEYVDRLIQLERLQREFFRPPQPGRGLW